MRPRQSLLLRGIPALAGFLIVACTAASTPQPTIGPTAPAATSSGASPTTASGALPKPELSTLRWGLSSAGEMSQFAGVQASMAKIFDKYGIKATVTAFDGQTRMDGALLAGQVDVGTGTSALTSQLTDTPVVVIAMQATYLTDDLVCSSAIKTAADVKGKKIAIGGFGSTAHASALLALKVLGLGAADAQMTSVGGQTSRFAAVKGGSVDCAVIDKSVQQESLDAGLNIVASVWKPPVQPFNRASAAVTRAFLEKYPNTALVTVAAVLEAQNMIWADTDATARNYAEWAQTSLDKATALVKDFQAIGNRSLLWTTEAFVNQKKVIVSLNPDVIDVDIQKAQDLSLLKKLIDSGFYAKIGNPATCVDWTPTKSC
jgi:NitT/TauT family transport system substrate-binding protein